MISFQFLEHTLGEGSAHDHAAHAGGGIEVLLARLAPAAVKVGVDLGHGGGVVDVGGIGLSVSSLSPGQSSRGLRAHLSKVATQFARTSCGPQILRAGVLASKVNGSARGTRRCGQRAGIGFSERGT
jgi:hypothetical protein